MKKLVVSILYILFHIIRNGCLPGNYGTFVIEQQLNEPWENVLGNAWRWAEALPTPAKPTESADEYTAIRWDADGGEHARKIYDKLFDSSLSYWSPEGDPFWDKLALFEPSDEFVNEYDEHDELPEWVLDELDGDESWEDECWF